MMSLSCSSSSSISCKLYRLKEVLLRFRANRLVQEFFIGGACISSYITIRGTCCLALPFVPFLRLMSGSGLGQLDPSVRKFPIQLSSRDFSRQSHSLPRFHYFIRGKRGPLLNLRLMLSLEIMLQAIRTHSCNITVSTCLKNFMLYVYFCLHNTIIFVLFCISFLLFEMMFKACLQQHPTLGIIQSYPP